MSNSTIDYPAEYLCHINHIGLLQITGADRKTFLQGQVTSDVDALSKHAAQLCCHCDFKGKTWNTLNIVEYNDSLFLLGDKSANELSLEQLKKYAVFSDVDIQQTSADWQILAGYGKKLEQTIAKLFGDSPFEHQQVFQNEHGFVVSSTAPQLRYMLVLSESGSARLLEDYDVELQSDALWRLMDIQSGIVQISEQTANEFVPQMLNMHLLNAISFEKGCYMGQEVVARTKYLGKNKRNSFILYSDFLAEAKPGETLERQLGDNWRRAGTVINSVHYQGKTCCLAVLASDTEQDAILRPKSTPEQQFVVLPLPYSLDD